MPFLSNGWQAWCNFYIPHTNRGDLTITLIAPDASACVLASHDAGDVGVGFGTGTAQAQRCGITDNGATFTDHPEYPHASTRISSIAPSDAGVGWHYTESGTDTFGNSFGMADPSGTWTLKVVDDSTGEVGTIEAASLFIAWGDGNGGDWLHRYDAIGAPAAIPDNSTTGASVTFAVGPPATVDPVVTVSLYATTDYVEDCLITLTAPDGTSQILSDFMNIWASGSDFGTSAADADRTVFADSATVSINAHPSPPSTPLVGSFIPNYPLWEFSGVDPTGDWTLNVTNQYDGGTVHAASLFITTGGTTTRYEATGLPATIPTTTTGVDITFGTAPPPDPPIGLLPRPLEPGYFRIKLTGLHYNSPARFAPTLARLEDFTEASVTIPINDAREASATISIHDPAAASVEPYKTMLHIVYATPTTAYLVFWGIVTQPVWDTEQETLTIPAMDMALRLQNRQVRWGTRILNASDDPDEPNPFNDTKPKRSTGFVPLDYVGLGWLRDAGRENAPQVAAGWPPLGITDGINTATGLALDTDYKIEARRGDNLWDVIQEMAGYQVMPDFELEPVDSTFGVYARLNTHPRQGSSDHSRLIFDNGFGRDNCLVTYQPGGKLVNYNHVLSTGDQQRVTVSDQDSAAIYGAYSQWDSTDYPAKAIAALTDTATQTINAYGSPPDYFSISPNLDVGMYYLDDFQVGDALTARVRRGQLIREFLGDITKVTLTQDDSAGNIKPELEVAVNVSRSITNETEG